MRKRDVALGASLLGAYAGFAATFRGPRSKFWDRMTAMGATLGALSLAAEPSLRRTRPRARDAALGLASAGALYAIFKQGDKLARRILPRGAEQIDDIYTLRELRPKPEIAARLALVIGPAEELFWRGFVQRRLQERFGTWPGAALATATYAGAHVVTGNLTLIGAAGTAGAFWGSLYAAGMPMGALIASHVAWDIWIFLLQPTA